MPHSPFLSRYSGLVVPDRCCGIVLIIWYLGPSFLQLEPGICVEGLEISVWG